MTILPILQYPDPRLRLAAAPVEIFDEGLRTLAQDLLETMRAAPGIGITAPHVGVPQRLVVLEIPPDNQLRIYVNPRIEWRSEELARAPEGSVSMPGVTHEIERPARVRIAFQDLDGTTRSEEGDGLLSVCLQHEIDQLDGIFWIQRLSRLKRDLVTRRYDKLRRLR
jgi:peptide deformylase